MTLGSELTTSTNTTTTTTLRIRSPEGIIYSNQSSRIQKDNTGTELPMQKKHQVHHGAASATVQKTKTKKLLPMIMMMQSPSHPLQPRNRRWRPCPPPPLSSLHTSTTALSIRTSSPRHTLQTLRGRDTLLIKASQIVHRVLLQIQSPGLQAPRRLSGRAVIHHPRRVLHA